jgi:uncharacterized membrane protein
MAKSVDDANTHHLRFHVDHLQLHDVFGGDWFARAAEQAVRFLGTPLFLVSQTIVVATWIVLNLSGSFSFDEYPFILLNLAFSVQAAYAAPMILLAQTRQADRDRAFSEADARHREDIASDLRAQQQSVLDQSRQILALAEHNHQLTSALESLTRRIEMLTEEIHAHVVTP